MLLLENIALAISSLLSNKMRALLTMLGIIIGIASVIAIETVGNSLTNSFTSEMDSMGANNITVGIQYKPTEEETTDSGMTFRGPERQRAATEDDLVTDEMLMDYITEFRDDIQDVSISSNLGNGEVTVGNHSAKVSVVGGNQGYFADADLTILAGHELDEKAFREGKGVCLVSDYLVDKLYKGEKEKALGETVEAVIGNKFYSYTIVGVYEYVSNGFSMESSDNRTTDLYTAVKSIQNKTHVKGYASFTVMIENGVDTDDFMKRTETFFDKYYHQNDYFKISCSSMKSLIGSLTDMLDKISLAISIIAGISLLVGGIGVMNIMLVSISERTREIGTRKALGATNASIRTQFIVESVVMCLIGGVFGIIVGVLGGSFGAEKLGYAAAPSVKSIVVSVLFSLFIGVFFGFYPANKAAKMNPIDALRYE